MNVGATSVSDRGKNANWTDAQTVPWGGAWRVPALEDIVELAEGTFWRQVSDYQSTGIAGFVVFKSKADIDRGKIHGVKYGEEESPYEPKGTYDEDSDDVHIFLPFTTEDKKGGHYWSSTGSAEDTADILYLSSVPITRDYTQTKPRTNTYFVRPVCD